MDLLSQDVKYIKGVGPLRAKLLAEELGVRSVGDLLYVFPYKYIDRTIVHTISQLQEDMPYVQLKGEIVDLATEGEGRRKRLRATFTDGTGYVSLVWFNSIKYLEKSLRLDRQYLLLGKPSAFNGRFSIVHPELDEAAQEDCGAKIALEPHYHTTEKMKKAMLTSKKMGEIVAAAFKAAEGGIGETLPGYIIRDYCLQPLLQSLRTAHFPENSEQVPPALRRLKFEELFYLQLDILRTARHKSAASRGFVFQRIGSHFMDFYQKNLPFELTGAQKRVVREIRKDLATGKQMNRLLQGDVGSGKTMVAFMACLIAADNGFQSCIMAPTEILAHQHLATLREMAKGLGLRIELLTGSVAGKERKEILARAAAGETDILIGTHALIEPTVVFQNLGLAVIDEQHRFGVKQRAKLWDKNKLPPHILVMTATPIPRTLAMTVYGDLDVSVIDELPPGRKPVTTIHYRFADGEKLHDGVLHQLSIGRQVYFVFPLIEESEKSDMRDLENGYAQIAAAFRDFKVGMVHGKMKPTEKDEIMRRFKNGELQILVSTTVIEVGVNVPNATVMVIENAERFGLSQLHQLRGRVGRGAESSYCILVTGNKLQETSRKRMQIMVETTDGFVIAEEDMRLRGPGDIEGTAQSGLPFDLKIADIIKDSELMAVAREAAAKLIEQDPGFELPQNGVVKARLEKLHEGRTNYSAIS